jgi:hypothetical protein
MNINDRVQKRFAELEAQGIAIPVQRNAAHGEGPDTVDDETFQLWASSAMHLVASVFGEDSPHFRNLEAEYKQFRGYAHQVLPVRGIFRAAKSDYDGGYLFSMQAAISGEIFGDFVTAAQAALSAEQKDVAAVLSCAALEDALKRFAQMKALNINDKDMTAIINTLKGAGLLSGSQKSLVDVMPRIRNAAMHADWGKITPQDVGSVIGFVEQFLLKNFV